MLTDYSKLAADYAKHRQLDPGVLRNLLEQGRISRESRVLEVGCGTGNYITALESLSGCACSGIDPSAEMLTRAQERNSRIDFKVGQAEHLAFLADTFDLVFSVDVIHHVQGRADYLRDAYWVLRPGGQVCTVTDSEWIIRHRQPLSTYFPETVEAELKRYPSTAELQSLMAAAGFKEISESLEQISYELADVQPYRDKAFSALHMISEEAYQRDTDRMEQDLRSGPIRCAARYVLIWGTK